MLSLMAMSAEDGKDSAAVSTWICFKDEVVLQAVKFRVQGVHGNVTFTVE
jgi:hypothetical protein